MFVYVSFRWGNGEGSCLVLERQFRRHRRSGVGDEVACQLPLQSSSGSLLVFEVIYMSWRVKFLHFKASARRRRSDLSI